MGAALQNTKRMATKSKLLMLPNHWQNFSYSLWQHIIRAREHMQLKNTHQQYTSTRKLKLGSYIHVLDEYKGRFINSQTSGELLTFVTSASRWPCWERALPVKHNFNWGMRRASCIKGDIPLKNGLENASSRQRTQKFDIVQGEILNTKPSMCLSRWSWAIAAHPLQESSFKVNYKVQVRYPYGVLWAQGAGGHPCSI